MEFSFDGSEIKAKRSELAGGADLPLHLQTPKYNPIHSLIRDERRRLRSDLEYWTVDFLSDQAFFALDQKKEAGTFPPRPPVPVSIDAP
jgi:hypothetical protein